MMLVLKFLSSSRFSDYSENCSTAWYIVLEGKKLKTQKSLENRVSDWQKALTESDIKRSMAHNKSLFCGSRRLGSRLWDIHTLDSWTLELSKSELNLEYFEH